MQQPVGWLIVGWVRPQAVTQHFWKHSGGVHVGFALRSNPTYACSTIAEITAMLITAMLGLQPNLRLLRLLLVGRALMPDTIRTQVTIGHQCPTDGCHGDRGLRRTKQVGFPNPTNTETPASPTVSDRHETVCRYKQYQVRGSGGGWVFSENSNACVAALQTLYAGYACYELLKN